MCDLIKCSDCIHGVVCGEKARWKKYIEDHLRLRKESALFDADPECVYYMDSVVSKGTYTDKEPYAEKKCDWCKLIGIRKANMEIGKFYNVETLQCPKCGAYHLVPR